MTSFRSAITRRQADQHIDRLLLRDRRIPSRVRPSR
jgi:hypothetical protein